MGGIDSYHWAFDGGGTADGTAVDHACSAAGVHTLALTVTVGGQSALDTAVVTVKPSPTDGLVVTVTDDRRVTVTADGPVSCRTPGPGCLRSWPMRRG